MSVQSAAADVDVDLRQLFASLARNWLRIVLVTLVVTGLAFALAWLATPYYKATAKLEIGSRESEYTRPPGTNDDDKPILDEQGVATQVQIISSPDILKQVATKLNLDKLPEFDETLKMSALGRILVLVGLKSDPFDIPPEERVLNAMHDKLNVYAVEKTRAIAIEFASKDPQLAADVANGIAIAYIASKSDAKLESNAAATDFLAPEIADLQNRVRDAEAKVAAFRAQSDLLMGGNNAVLPTQQLAELSSELSRVRASRAAAEASAESVRRALQNGGSLDSVPEVLSSELIQRLRERQVELRANIADLSTTLLDNHPRIRALKSQLADLDGQIRNEAQKIIRGLSAQVQTAKAREDQLVADVNTLKAASARAGEQQVQLDALQRDANVQRQQLESYMASYNAAASRKDRKYSPVAASLIAQAQVPSQPYFPKIGPITGAAAAASLLLMAIGTLLGELFSGRAMRPAPGARFESIEQVAMPVARTEPAIDDQRRAFAPYEEAAPGHSIAEAELPRRAESEPVEVHAPAAGPADSVDGPSQPGKSALEPRQSRLGEIDVDKAAEKLIASGAARAIFVSPEGDEAAASAVLVAREVSDAGLRVLLLDLTASGAASRPMLDSSLFPGITNLLASEAQFSDVIHPDLYSDAHVIPVGTADPVRAMRAADRLPIIMQSLTTAYDLVVVECGPADAQGISRLVGDGTEVFLSMLEADDQVTQAAVKLIENGYPDVTLVTPVGHEPGDPLPGRRSAA
ncbi:MULTISPECIES: exopolysaccharide transport family protein [unclassified Mesorhizobium]|uniref:GumC family protein n=2 Tax=Mesorhizobium TaxID=68287 RepID=UPI000F75A3DE|nr:MULTISPECIES: exopolysaccharide transport family protein [unclassified Mesorhizobium]AZO06926.1 chain-length determining protein [Mesorhizobium sp. M2A.F.Ca.ET.043.02.1.1]RUW41017.1 chain-length determining protein [Mesorhizobium sp. M2A.F.Ca.ET.015.02.1.1]RVC94528.1 chain-length determining protein [Mesorhizobium sp. M2A.F.Ca.ET.017.03.2.1]RVD07963.1 chain-length determining protein [Mesorhizobium sp. M2A.F.Ca.ET.029.05.1.1]RWB38363.1 MAG: chain-length determining protein [Mesorhizobium sp